jgi:hypothetical protein
MEKIGKMHIGRYNMNNKKRAIANREGLLSDEEELYDL